MLVISRIALCVAEYLICMLIVTILTSNSNIVEHSDTMKSAICVSLLLVCVLQISHGATISQIIIKISETQNYLQQQINEAKSSIKSNIDSARNSLNSRAESIKINIKNGPNNCQVWLDQISSIQKHQINFLYQFQVCEMSSRLINMRTTESALRDLTATAQKLQAICSLRGSNCQGQINSLDNNVDLIRVNIGNDINGIKRDSVDCVNGKVKSATESLDRVENYWKNCAGI